MKYIPIILSKAKQSLLLTAVILSLTFSNVFASNPDPQEYYLSDDCFEATDDNGHNFQCFFRKGFNNQIGLRCFLGSGKDNLPLQNADFAIPSHMDVDGITFTVTEISSEFFNRTHTVDRLFIPATIRVIGNYNFYNSKIRVYDVDPANPWFKSSEGAIYSKDLKELMFYPYGEEEIVLPEHVNRLGAYSFSYRKDIKRVIIGPNVKSIGKYCFQFSGITEITIPENCVLDRSEYGCFYKCENLTKATLPESLESIDNYCFNGCISLKEVVLPRNLKRIGNYAFEDCNITELKFPENLTTIGWDAFRGTTLVKAVVPDGAESLDMAQAFCGAQKLEELTIGNNVRSLEISANDNLFFFTFGTAMERIVIYRIPPFLEVNARATTAPVLDIQSSEKPSDLQLRFCKIHVPPGCRDSYIEKGWDFFGTVIDDLDMSGVCDATAENAFAPGEICEVYRPTGEKLAGAIQFKDISTLAAKGIVIVRSAVTGKTVKTVVN